MPYYHVRILRKGSSLYSYEANLSKDDVEKIGEQYREKRKLLFGGEWVEPLNIEEILIRKTKSHSKEYADLFERGVARIFKLGYGTNVTRQFIISPPSPPTEASDLVKAAEFLGLDTNWSLATTALQLQEVAIVIIAKKKGIKLDKPNVERILNRQVGTLSFNEKYEAFSKTLKTLYNIEMPILTAHLRKMRTNVLHKGYNPKPEETASIIIFTTGLLKRLNQIEET